MNEQLYSIVSRVLEIPEGDLADSLTREETESWDSFNHLLLITTIESEMDIKFTMSQVEKVKTLGELTRVVEASR